VERWQAIKAAIVAFGICLLAVLLLSTLGSCANEETKSAPVVNSQPDAGAVEGGADCTCYHHEIYDSATNTITVWTDCDPNE
jgi:hypothetical protein